MTSFVFVLISLFSVRGLIPCRQALLRISAAKR